MLFDSNYLTQDERNRYSRHILLDEIGEKGQLKLKQASVLVVGAGGLGVPVLQYLVAAGVGKIGIVDDDVVEESNLQRQVLYSTAHIGKKKADVAAKNLFLLNPNIQYQSFLEKIHSDNAFEIVNDYNIIVDGTDNFPARYLLNDLCVKLDKTLVSGAIFKFEGQIGVFNHLMSDGKRSGTYRCLFPQAPSADDSPDCATTGVMGIVPGLIGMMQAVEVVKLITGVGKLLVNELLLIDIKENSYRNLSFHRDEKAAAKIKNEPLSSSEDYKNFCSSNEVVSYDIAEISSKELKRRIKAKEDFQLIDVREPSEHELINIGGELMPMNDIFFHTHKINKQKPVIIYCKVGERSEWVIRQLQDKYGFNNLYNLKGGMRAFLADGN